MHNLNKLCPRDSVEKGDSGRESCSPPGNLHACDLRHVFFPVIPVFLFSVSHSLLL